MRPSTYKVSLRELSDKWGISTTTIRSHAKNGCNWDASDTDIAAWLESYRQDLITSKTEKRNALKEVKLKTCPRCGQTKQRSGFHKSKSSRDGLVHRCRSCTREIYQEKNKDKIEERNRRAAREKKMREMGMKTCNRCEEIKPYSDFHKNKTTGDGYVTRCKSCMLQIYQEKNKDSIEAKNKRIAHNKKHKKAKDSARAKAKYQRDIEASRATRREADRRRKHKRNEYERHRYANDPDYRLTCQIRKRTLKALKNNSKSDSTVGLLGCSIQYAKKHLESQFADGMNWDNHGVHGWHIDHIRPCDSFDLSDPEQQRQCFHYTNLQPLWAVENESKGNLMPDNHQPELPIPI